MFELPKTGLVDADALAVRLAEPQLVIFDCRYSLHDPQKAATDYQSGHIPGAYKLDMEADLASEVNAHGGRHPIPSPDTFSKRLRECGVNQDSYCVAYDEDGSGAARLWWLLRYFGHERVGILNGGIVDWNARSLPLSVDIPPQRNGNFVARPGSMPTIGVGDLSQVQKYFLMDSRNAVRYRGEQEPIDVKAGHIPGARSFNYQEVFEKPARYLPAESLKRHFAAVRRDQEVVVYCGSGVTACVNLFALSQIGIQGLLYPGSWSDWITYHNNPIAIGEERPQEG